MSFRTLVIPAVAAAASLALLWLTDCPLGVPEEWTWDRHSFAETTVSELAWGIGPAVILLGGYIVCVRWLLPAENGATSQRIAGKLCALTLSGFAAVWMMQSAAPGPYADLQHGWVAYDRAHSGYFYEAVHSDKNTAEFLIGYEAMMAGDYLPFGKKKKQRDIYHIGTHPPGLILMHRGLLSLCRRSPEFSGVVLATEPQAAKTAFLELEKITRGLTRRNTEAERAALWLSVLLTHFIAVATVVPLFFLVKQDFGSRRAWMTASFWPLAPAVAVFLPKSDALYPFCGLLFLWIWRAALHRRSALLASLAGGVMWLGMLLSLAMLPIALFAVVLTCWETFGRVESNGPHRCWKHNAYLAFIAVAFFIAAIAVFYRWTLANLPMIWLENFRNHAGFYQQESHPRTYTSWLLANPLELAFGVGAPITSLAVMQLVRVVRTQDGWRLRENGPLLSAAVVIGILWLSGKNMGEAGRLWLFLMPWVIWMTADFWRETRSSDKPPLLSQSTIWQSVLVLQSVVCLLTVIRVQGFRFGG